MEQLHKSWFPMIVHNYDSLNHLSDIDKKKKKKRRGVIDSIKI